MNLVAGRVTRVRPSPINVELPEPMSYGWNKIPGVRVEGSRLTVNPAEYFFRYGDPSWILCAWDGVRHELLDVDESPDVAVEQQALDYVKAHGVRTTEPSEVLRTAFDVYGYIFRDEHLMDPSLDGVAPEHLRMLRQMGVLMALNRVELDGAISNVGPAWMFPATCRVVFNLSESEAGFVDELYHGTFFNESRRVESVKAHAALGGRLVHGCQSVPDQSGGCVVPYGCDIARFRAELNAFKREWTDAVLACRSL
ncbi:MAG: hypothetical protein ACRDQA_13955 [Nocardioidaceae bacterium]